MKVSKGMVENQAVDGSWIKVNIQEKWNHLADVVRESLEETLNGLLDAGLSLDANSFVAIRKIGGFRDRILF